jgi:hypothetical protein
VFKGEPEKKKIKRLGLGFGAISSARGFCWILGNHDRETENNWK